MIVILIWKKNTEGDTIRDLIQEPGVETRVSSEQLPEALNRSDDGSETRGLGTGGETAEVGVVDQQHSRRRHPRTLQQQPEILRIPPLVGVNVDEIERLAIGVWSGEPFFGVAVLQRHALGDGWGRSREVGLGEGAEALALLEGDDAGSCHCCHHGAEPSKAAELECTQRPLLALCRSFGLQLQDRCEEQAQHGFVGRLGGQ